MKVTHSEMDDVDYFRIKLTSIDLDYLDMSHVLCKDIEVKDKKVILSINKELKDELYASEEG